MSGLKTTEARLNVFVRLVGTVFLVLGVVLAYLVATTPLAPQIVPVYDAVAGALGFVGFLALIAKLD